jgi:hypothetical protein
MANRTIEFRPEGPFRDFVVAFWIGHHGLFDLFTRGVYAHSEEMRRQIGGTEQDQKQAISNMVADGRMPTLVARSPHASPRWSRPRVVSRIGFPPVSLDRRLPWGG